jgi:hypothetical protein
MEKIDRAVRSVSIRRMEREREEASGRPQKLSYHASIDGGLRDGVHRETCRGRRDEKHLGLALPFRGRSGVCQALKRCAREALCDRIRGAVGNSGDECLQGLREGNSDDRACARRKGVGLGGEGG